MAVVLCMKLWIETDIYLIINNLFIIIIIAITIIIFSTLIYLFI